MDNEVKMWEKTRKLRKISEIFSLPKSLFPDIIQKIYKLKYINEGIVSISLIDDFSSRTNFQRINISYYPDLALSIGYRHSNILEQIKREIYSIAKEEKLNPKTIVFKIDGKEKFSARFQFEANLSKKIKTM